MKIVLRQQQNSLARYINLYIISTNAWELQNKTESHCMLYFSSFPFFYELHSKKSTLLPEHISIVSFLHTPECHAQIENFIDRIKHIKT